MVNLKNDRLIRAIKREALDRTPTWIMRQAGRYLPEYRKLRKQAGSFMQLCTTPELAAEVTLQPLARFDLDAAIVFSDILTIPDAMGMELSFIEGSGPYFKNKIADSKNIHSLHFDQEQLSYVYEAIKLIKSSLHNALPLIGFCGSPWTVAAYMLEGCSKPSFPTIRMLKEKNPALLHVLLKKLTCSIISHFNEQINAGVDVIMLFDTWGGLLQGEDYTTFSLAYAKHIIDTLHGLHNKKVPSILFTKGGAAYLEMMVETAWDVIGVDASIDLNEARNRIQDKKCLQGNLSPEILMEPAEVIQTEVKKVLSSFGKGSGHIFNLGHGVTPQVPPEHVHVLVEAVKTFSAQYHQN